MSAAQRARKASRAEQREQGRANERVSGASEQANGRASGPVLCVFGYSGPQWGGYLSFRPAAHRNRCHNFQGAAIMRSLLKIHRTRIDRLHSEELHLGSIEPELWLHPRSILASSRVHRCLELIEGSWVLLGLHRRK